LTADRETDTMGVYGTSGTLDAADIDYDDDEETTYILCTNCEEEYCEDELTTMTEDGLYQENVCEDCIEGYKRERQALMDEMIEHIEERWNSGDIIKVTYR
jgi:hypothetical protein